MNGNVVEKMIVKFLSNKELEIEGIYLHKFLATPPKAVSDEEENYIKHNPYTKGNVEELIQNIRNSFAYVLEVPNMNPELEKYKQISIVYDSDSFKIQRFLYPTLDKAVEDFIIDKLKTGLNTGLEMFDHSLKSFIKESLLKPKIKQDFIRDGDGLKNSFTEEERGDVSYMLLKDFLFELDAFREDGVPFYTKYIDRLTEYSKGELAIKLKYIIEELVVENPNYMDKLYEYIGGKESVEEFTDAIMKDEETQISRTLLNYWWDSYSDKTIGDILK